MIKNFLATAVLLCSTYKPVEYPKNMESPHFHVQENGDGIKYWIVLEPKCVVETVYTKGDPIGTEITILDPENTDQKSIVNFVNSIEGIDQETYPMTFAGMNEDHSQMYTLTSSEHILLWKRNPSTEKIEKIIIVYHKQNELHF